MACHISCARDADDAGAAATAYVCVDCVRLPCGFFLEKERP